MDRDGGTETGRRNRTEMDGQIGQRRTDWTDGTEMYQQRLLELGTGISALVFQGTSTDSGSVVTLQNQPPFPQTLQDSHLRVPSGLFLTSEKVSPPKKIQMATLQPLYQG